MSQQPFLLLVSSRERSEIGGAAKIGNLSCRHWSFFILFLKRQTRNSWGNPSSDEDIYAAGIRCRVSEVVGLRWQDINMADGYIEINHNMVYYQRETVIFLLQHQKLKLEIV